MAPVDAEAQIAPAAPAAAEKAAPSKTLLAKVWAYLLEQWFIIGLGVAIGFAAAVPQLGATRGYIRSEYSIKLPAIIIIFIISGMGLKTKVLLSALADLRIHLLIQGISLALIPAIGYGVALGLRASAFDPHLADGLVIMACMPTTVSTNVVYTARAAGNEAAALVNAVIGNIIGIFIMPLWLSHFLSVQGAAPYAAVLLELTYTIIGPLIVGQAMQYLAPQAVAWIKAHINTANVSSLCILLLVWITFCNTFASGATKQVPGRDVAATIFLDVALFVLFAVLSFVLAWPPPPVRVLRKVLRLRPADAVAVVICGSTKTVALGVPLINVMYKQVPYAGLLAMPLIFYHALQVLLGGLMLGRLGQWCIKEGSAAAAAAAAAAAPAAAAAATGAAAAGTGGGDGGGIARLTTGSRRWSLARLLTPAHRHSSVGDPEHGEAPAATAAAGTAAAAAGQQRR